MWIPALDSLAMPSPATGPVPAPGAEPVAELPGAPELPPATPDPAPPAEEPAAPTPSPGDLAAIEEKLNALLEAAGLGIRVRLLGPLPEGAEEVALRPERPGEDDVAPVRHRHRHRHGHGVGRGHGHGHGRGHGAAAVTAPADEEEQEMSSPAASLPPGIVARLATILAEPAPDGSERLG